MLLPIYDLYVDARGSYCHLICLSIGYGRLNERFAWSNPEKRYINKAVLLLLYIIICVLYKHIIIIWIAIIPIHNNWTEHLSIFYLIKCLFFVKKMKLNEISDSLIDKAIQTF